MDDELREKIKGIPALRDRLIEATERLNDSLERAEEVFERVFGLEAKGRVVLKPRVHLVFRGGEFIVERLQGNRPPSTRWLLDESREVRILAAKAIRQLFESCGGQFSSVESPR